MLHHVEHGGSVLELQTCNRESPGSNPPHCNRSLGIFILTMTRHVIGEKKNK